jgi:N-acylglucosamine-6-phosphate 2-epimerase
MSMMDSPDVQGIRLDMTDTANDADREYLDARLKEYNNTRSEYFRESRLPGQGAQPLDIYLRDAAGRIQGGLVAFTIWGWLYLDVLWLDESLRRHGYGTRLVQTAEAEARRRGCTHAHLRTFSFQARGFYEKCGYRVIGALEGYPPGQTFYWMRKDFTES